MKENLYRLAAQALLTHEAREERRKLRPWVQGTIGLVCFVALVYAANAYAEPIARASAGGISITVYSEPCALKEVSNLPARATWTENGKTFEGCAAANPELGVVVFFFREDKSVAAVPMQAFAPVIGV